MRQFGMIAGVAVLLAVASLCSLTIRPGSLRARQQEGIPDPFLTAMPPVISAVESVASIPGLSAFVSLQPATPLAAAVAIGQPGLTTVPASLTVESVTQTIGEDTFTWSGDALRSPVYLLTNTDIVVRGRVPKEAGPTWKLDDLPPGKSQANDNAWALEIKTPQLSGKPFHTLSFELADSAPVVLTFGVPTAGEKIEITGFADARRIPFSTEVDLSRPVVVYQSFLRLQVKSSRPQPPQTLAFRQDKQSAHTYHYVLFPSDARWNRPSVDLWQAELDAPSGLGTAELENRLFLMAGTARGAYGVSENALKFVIKVAEPMSVPQIMEVNGNPPDPRTRTAYTNNPSLEILGGPKLPIGAHLAIFRDGAYEPILIGGEEVKRAQTEWKTNVALGSPGDYILKAAFLRGKEERFSEGINISIRTTGPRDVVVDPLNLAFTPGSSTLTVRFGSDNPLNPDDARNRDLFAMQKLGAGNAETAPSPLFYPDTNMVVLQYGNLPPGTYKLTIKPELRDVYGNRLGKSVGEPNGKSMEFQILKPEGSDLPQIAPGIKSTTGPFVEFPEFTQPRKVPDGFNPSDHVETRVVRLYYYRDAHRVAQIVNRDVRSHNRVAVDVRRRLAEEARTTASKLTQSRQIRERNAVQAARESREAERLYASAQIQLAEAQRNEAPLRQAYNDLSAQEAAGAQLREEQKMLLARARLELPQAQSNLTQARERVNSALAAAQAARTREVTESEASQQAIAQEDNARAEVFRLETAAAHEDPDTYAPGDPKSDDPVKQVSVSVIGEAVIQLRGPIKGINIIRRMINQIDQPAGQVRIAIHTVQINGEHGDRMERVASRIQDYIDHSRFLTVQSALMLRKAVILVGSRKAEEAVLYCQGQNQEARDLKYLHAFFGRDFIDELRVLDSEFLKTGNKLLSLHSMDTTSLASALFLLALAKNTTRQEILREFQRMLDEQLPLDEQRYYEAGGDRKNGKCDKFMLLAQNARFQSFLGFFNSEILGDDTISPLQREFIRLAQVFKSQLVTEMELNQRVTERALIEQRMGDYQKELREQLARENEAKRLLEEAQKAVLGTRVTVLTTITDIVAEINRVGLEAAEASRSAADVMTAVQREVEEKLTETAKQPKALQPKQLEPQVKKDEPEPKQTDAREQWDLPSLQNRLRAYQADSRPQMRAPSVSGKLAKDPKSGRLILEKAELDLGSPEANQAFVSALEGLGNFVNRFAFKDPYPHLIQEAAAKLAQIRSELDKGGKIRLEQAKVVARNYHDAVRHVFDTIQQVERQAAALALALTKEDTDVGKVYGDWVALRQSILRQVREPGLAKLARDKTAQADDGFNTLLEANSRYTLTRQTAERSRRPLDHKKLLDMLIDEVEDKYIELLEGTRSHTANVDDYIKRLATALEDDFNTQYYLPAFREVRHASRYWDVTMSQVETTSILTNNRMFAKVDPQATMEFDLPRRDTLITEAMTGAKAMIDQYGALVNDPTFLSLVKMRSGQPTTSMQQGQGGAFPPVRSPYPSLSRSPDERILAQVAPADRQYAAPLEALIPEPAVYKFETGTGYEIRPVIQPDGQSVVFHFNYMYTTNIREPIRPDEKHLGRIKRHYIDTNVQLGNYELREISRYQVALKAARTSRGVPLLEDIPGVGILFRPLPSAESSLQQNLILGQSVIYPTLFDLMGLRWAPAISDIDPLATSNAEFVVRNRRRVLQNQVFDFSSSKVDEFLRIPPAERRTDLYRTQETIPSQHPNGYSGPGLGLRDSQLREGYSPSTTYPETRFVPRESPDGSLYRREPPREGMPRPGYIITPGDSPELRGLPTLPPNDGAPLLPNPRTVQPGEPLTGPLPAPAIGAPPTPMPTSPAPGPAVPAKGPPGSSQAKPRAGGIFSFFRKGG